MKKVILVHGWDGSPEGDWFPWIINELKNKDFEVIAPLMPNAEAPEIDAWLTYLANEVKTYDEETIFVGHSIGCQTIMRYFELQNTRAKGAIFVAGWFNLVNLESKHAEQIAKPWIETSINLDKVKNNLGAIKVILSENDQWVPFEETKRVFNEKLGAEVISIPNGGHLTSDDGFDSFPMLVNLIAQF